MLKMIVEVNWKEVKEYFQKETRQLMEKKL